MCCTVLYCALLCYEKCPHLQTGASMSPEPTAPGHRHQQLLASLDAGEVLPEADIVSNILDKLERNLRTASSLLAHTQPGQETEHFLEAEAGQQGATLSRALELFRRLYLHLGRAEAGLEDTYDGDKEEEEEEEEDTRRRRKGAGGKRRAAHRVKLQGDKHGGKADKLQYLVRDVIFYIGSQ